MLVGILVPEYIVVWAIRQFAATSRIIHSGTTLGGM
jgi:hypothetical protein